MLYASTVGHEDISVIKKNSRKREAILNYRILIIREKYMKNRDMNIKIENDVLSRYLLED